MSTWYHCEYKYVVVQPIYRLFNNTLNTCRRFFMYRAPVPMLDMYVTT